VILLIIEVLHKMGFVHRDIKPNNIMIENNGMVKLIDMGSVKIHDIELQKQYLNKNITNNNQNDLSTASEIWRNEAFSSVNKGETFVGTEGYISPEMLLNDEVGVECDIWAFGCLA